MKSVGYATFSIFAMKILIAGGSTGTGSVFNKRIAKPIYMNIAEVQADLSIGIQSFQNSFVFQSDAALNDFVNSDWAFGGK